MRIQQVVITLGDPVQDQAEVVQIIERVFEGRRTHDNGSRRLLMGSGYWLSVQIPALHAFECTGLINGGRWLTLSLCRISLRTDPDDRHDSGNRHEPARRPARLSGRLRCLSARRHRTWALPQIPRSEEHTSEL